MGSKGCCNVAHYDDVRFLLGWCICQTRHKNADESQAYLVDGPPSAAGHLPLVQALALLLPLVQLLAFPVPLNPKPWPYAQTLKP